MTASLKVRLPTITDDDQARVSRFDVERLACGELKGDEERRVREAVDANPALRALFDDIVAEDAAFRVSSPAPAFLAALELKVARPSPWQRLLAALRLPSAFAAVGAAAVVVIVIGVGRGGDDVVTDVGPSIRTKGGGPRVAFFVKSDEGARAGVPGEALRAGDRIQLALGDSAKGTVVVLGVDGAGRTALYANLPSHTSKGSAGLVPLPQALALDDSVGVERFFAVYGDEAGATEAAAMKAAAELGARVRGGADLASLDKLELGAGFEQASVHITKVR